MPIPYKPITTLGSLFGLGYLEDSEASPFGIKRFPKLFHGIRGNPDLATEVKEDILNKGFLEGESAQYNAPGTSVTHDPWLAERVYTGQFAGLARGHALGPNKDVVLGIDPLAQPSEVKNVSPASHVSGVAGDTLEKGRLHSLPSFWHSESEIFAPRDENGIQRLIRPRLRNEIESKLIDEMVRVDENYINSTQRLMDYEKQAVANWKSSTPHQRSTASPEKQRYDEKRLIQDWITNLSALRGNESLFRQRFDIEFIGRGTADFGAPNPIKDIRGFAEPYQKVVSRYIDKALLGPNGEITPKYIEYRRLRDSTASIAENLNEYNAFFKDPDEWTDEFKDLKDDMYRGGPIAKTAEQKLTDLYSTYYKRRDELFNFLKENIGDMPRKQGRASLPAVGVAAAGAGSIAAMTPTEEAEAGIIGPKGFNKLAKLGKVPLKYKDAITEAEILENQGVSPVEIFKTLGLARNSAYGGQWTGAISDKPAKYAENYALPLIKGAELAAKDVYNHPELYQLYPSLKNMPVTLENLGPERSGTYSPYADTRLRRIFNQHLGEIGVSGPNESALESVLSHEFGHAVQHEEKMPTGGSPEMAKYQWTSYAGQAIADLLSNKRTNEAIDVLNQWNDMQIGPRFAAYQNLGGETLSRQNEMLLRSDKLNPNNFAENAVNAMRLGEGLKPSGYILPEHATNEKYTPNDNIVPLDYSSYHTLINAYHNTSDPKTKDKLLFLLDQYVPTIKKVYGVSFDDFLKDVLPAGTKLNPDRKMFINELSQNPVYGDYIPLYEDYKKALMDAPSNNDPAINETYRKLTEYQRTHPYINYTKLNYVIDNPHTPYKVTKKSILGSHKAAPVIGAAGLGQYANYDIGEARPAGWAEEKFATTPLGQAATGLMRSIPETGAELLDETQRLGSEFYGLPKRQSGTKMLRYLENEGVIPRKTDTGWEILGGLLSPL